MKQCWILILCCLIFGACSKPKAPFFFIQLSDPQFGMIENNESFAQETSLVERTVEAINRLQPDLVVVTGDLVNDPHNDEQIKEWKRLSAMINPKIKLFMVPGNHDVGNDATPELVEKYKANYGNDRFAFHHKGVCFIGYNSCLIKTDRPNAESEQLKWLEKTLNSCEKGERKLLFAHHPFYLQTPDEADKYENIPAEKRAKYTKLLDRYHVRNLFVGHLHKNHKAINGLMTTEILTGLCRSFEGNPGFNVVKVYPDRIETQFYDINNVPNQVEL